MAKKCLEKQDWVALHQAERETIELLLGSSRQVSFLYVFLVEPTNTGRTYAFHRSAAKVAG